MSRDLLAACERGVERALARGAEAAEVYAQRERGGAAELEKGHVSSAAWGEASGLGVRILQSARVGFAYATREENLPAAIDQAFAALRLGKRLPRFRFPTPGKPRSVIGLYDKRVEALEGEDLVALGGRLIDAVADVRADLLVAGGSVHAGLTEYALANSEGVARHGRDTGVGAHVYVVQRRDGVSTGFASAESTRHDVRWEHVGREAGELAVASAKPTPLEAGRALPCVVRPDSASDLLSTITVPSLYGKPAHRGESFYSNKRGKHVAHERLALIDDATVPRGLGSTPFDDEGVPTRPRKLIDGGVLKTFLYDAYDAAEWGQRSTGNAVRQHAFDGRSYKSPPSTSALQMRLVAPSTTTERLISGVDDGLLVHDMMGVHTANATSGDFSVTSSVLFRIRKGAVEGPVAPLSVAGNLHQALRRGVRMGNDVKAMGGAPAWRLPSVLFEGFTVTP
jgi:PmbA protein